MFYDFNLYVLFSREQLFFLFVISLTLNNLANKTLPKLEALKAEPMDPVQILSSKGITEENKHSLGALANLLASYSFRDEKDKLRATKEIANQVYAISVLLKEISRGLQLVCNEGETHVESGNVWHMRKRRRTL